MSVKGFLEKYFKTEVSTTAKVAPTPATLLEPMVGSISRTQLDFYNARPTVAPSNLTTLNLFTDGACSDNGKRSAKGGYGVHVYGKPQYDISTPLFPNEQQTNNRGELRAIQAALDLIEQNQGEWGTTYTEYFIWSDSEYSIHSLTKWAKGWKASGWKKRDGQPIQNIDIIKPLYERIQRMPRVSLHHVRAHQDLKRNEFPFDGNIRADALATASIR